MKLTCSNGIDNAESCGCQWLRYETFFIDSVFAWNCEIPYFIASLPFNQLNFILYLYLGLLNSTKMQSDLCMHHELISWKHFNYFNHIRIISVHWNNFVYYPDTVCCTLCYKNTSMYIFVLLCVWTNKN